MIRRLVACSAGLLLVANSFSWIDEGHMVVAAIAARELKPEVRQKIDALLQTGGDEKTRDFYTAACWADDTRTKTTGPWHYIDIYFRSDGKPATHKPDAENVDWAIDKFSKVLADTSASRADRADALRYLIHFVGDSHQPLHATSRESDDMPDGDAGGNRVKLQPISGIDMYRPNLHALWDFGCGLFTNTKRPLTAEGKSSIESIADQILKDCPVDSLPNKDDMAPADWSNEGFEVAKSQVYGINADGTVSAEYLAQGKKTCEQRVALAGHRLAALLNRLLG